MATLRSDFDRDNQDGVTLLERGTEDGDRVGSGWRGDSGLSPGLVGGEGGGAR